MIATDPQIQDPEEDVVEEINDTPDTMSAWSSWKQSPNPNSLSTALRSVDPVIEKSVSRYPGMNKSLMRSQAKSLAIQAFKTYDPESGASLSTHVFNHLRPLSRFADRQTKVVSVPRDFRAQVSGFIKFKQDFLEEQGREPSDDEIANRMGLSKKQIAKLNQGSFYELAEGGTEAPVEVSSDDDALGTWVEFVYHDLPERDKLIMDYRIGRNGKPVLSAEQIAQKMNIDPSYVRKRSAVISKRILDGVNG